MYPCLPAPFGISLSRLVNWPENEDQRQQYEPQHDRHRRERAERPERPRGNRVDGQVPDARRGDFRGDQRQDRGVAARVDPGGGVVPGVGVGVGPLRPGSAGF